MRLSEFISELQKLKDEHGGDLEVETCRGMDWERVPVDTPRLSYKLLLFNPYDAKRFWTHSFYPEYRKGEKVVEV